MLRDAAQQLHDEANDLSRLMDSLLPPRCKHRHATMVQATHRELGWFVTWQCDDCGYPLNDRPVTADDIECGDQLPWLDEEMLLATLNQISTAATAATAFFGGKTE